MKIPFLFRPLFFLLFVTGLISCEKDVSDKLNFEVQDRLVIISFLSPQDTAITVKLQRTQPALGRQLNQQELKITNGIVNISDGSQTIQLQYNAQRDVYRAKKSLLPIVVGKTYSLNVTTPNGWKATGTCTVPTTNGIAITSYQLSAEESRPGDWFTGLRHSLIFKWQDTPGAENYYRPLAYREAPNSSNPNFPKNQQTFNAFYDANNFVTDEQQDGKELTSMEMQIHTPKPDDFPRPYQLHLWLQITDKDYYLYHRSVNQQSHNDGNPFAEPTLLYTNITGGLGIFAAYNVIKDVRQIN